MIQYSRCVSGRLCSIISSFSLEPTGSLPFHMYNADNKVHALSFISAACSDYYQNVSWTVLLLTVDAGNVCLM